MFELWSTESIFLLRTFWCNYNSPESLRVWSLDVRLVASNTLLLQVNFFKAIWMTIIPEQQQRTSCGNRFAFCPHNKFKNWQVLAQENRLELKNGQNLGLFSALHTVWTLVGCEKWIGGKLTESCSFTAESRLEQTYFSGMARLYYYSSFFPLEYIQTFAFSTLHFKTLLVVKEQ